MFKVKKEENGGSYQSSETVHPFDDLSSVDYTADPGYQVMAQYGLNHLVIAEFCELMRAGVFTFSDLDERTMEFAKSQNHEHARYVLNQFRKSNLIGVHSPVQYLGSLLKNFKERVKQLGAELAMNTPIFYAPSVDSLQNLLNRTGYNMEVTIGQRKYGGPPPGYDGPLPGNGCECYIGRIPNSVYEDEMVPLLEKYGTLYDFRLMMDPVSGTNKGYAFATFMEKKEAAEAAKRLEGYEVKPGKKLRCNVSIANTRLFIGNIPKSKSKEEILKEFSENSEFEGVRDVIIYADAEDPVSKKNCGYCFVEFVDHKSASTAKRRLVDGHVKPFNANVVANWAEPQEEPDDEVMSQVRTIFVKNLREVATEDVVRKAFGVFGEVYKVRRIKDYAFVYFSDRECALQAVEKMNNQEFHGSVIDVALAKPQSESRKKLVQARVLNKQQGMMGDGTAMGGDSSYYGYDGGYYGGGGYGAGAGYGGYNDPTAYGADASGYGGGYGAAAAGGGYDYGYGSGAGIQYPMTGAMAAAAGQHQPYPVAAPRPMMRGSPATPRPMGGARGATGGMGMRARASPAMAAQFRMGRGGAGGAMGASPQASMGGMGGFGMRGGRGGLPVKRPMNGAGGGGYGGLPAKRGRGMW